MNASGTVLEVTSKDVSTKWGTKPVWSFKLSDAQWYKTGFKKPPLSAGQEVVSLEYIPSRYGNEVKEGTIVVGGSVPVQTNLVLTSVEPAAPVKTYPIRGTFPIPALSGERSIIRQNALTQARELFTASIGNTPERSVTEKVLIAQVEIIKRLARLFEGYSAGDDDVAAVLADMEKEKETTKS